MLEDSVESHPPEKPQALSAIVVFCFSPGSYPADVPPAAPEFLD